MVQFEELQALWQGQPPVAARAVDAAALAGAFRRYGRRQDIINTAKSVLLTAVLVQSVVFLRHRPMMMFGITLILFCGVLALIAEWRNQRAIARVDFSAPSVEFVRRTAARVAAQRNPFLTREYLVLFGAAFVGYQAMVFASWYKWTVPQRVFAHSFAAVSPAIIYAAGKWLRAKRWNAECGPLMERLSLLAEKLEDRAL
jgi:hypothetical protein